MCCYRTTLMFFPWLPIKGLTSQLPAIHMAGKSISKYCTANVNIAQFFTPYVYGRYERQGKSLFVTPGNWNSWGSGEIGRAPGGCSNPPVRFLILSDIHANWDALDAVLNARRGSYDLVLNCGDLVGYGPEPNRVVDWCRATNAAVVRGNHDKAAVGLTDLEWFNPVASSRRCGLQGN